MMVPGTRIGPYEVTGPLGAGGMGEVYRARDTKLHREVAVKILPETWAGDPDRLSRFEREARVLAALNHPHIAQVFGLEESGATRALVMELIEGDDLADRLTRGPMPVSEAIAIARQIADALDAAHERGIVHRDLKPANIRIKPDGTVKVLDFGLAKGMGGRTGGAGGAGGAGGENSDGRTVTAQIEVTEPGMVMGTAGYMSPEQAAGLPVDARTDIWAFGCVLYEMLSGRQPFRGRTNVETIASVIKGEPDWTGMTSLPPSLQLLMRRCLQKDLRQRLHHMADVRIALDDALSAPAVQAAPTAAPASRWWKFAAGLVLAAGLGAASAITIGRTSPPPPPGVLRFEITPPPEQPFTGRPTGLNLAISPDGRTIIYHAIVGDNYQLVRRNLDSVVATPIAGTERAQSPTFSPDGSQIAFYSGGAIRTVPLAGGTPLIVCDSPGGAPFLAWLDSGEIAIGRSQELLSVPEKGGAPKRLVVPNPQKDERGFFGLSALPGGGLLTIVNPAPGGRARVHLAALARGASELKSILEDVGIPQYVPGYLLVNKQGALNAMPFNLDRLEVSGEPFVLDASPLNQVSVARNGSYVALRPNTADVVSDANFNLRLVWLGRDGRQTGVVATDVQLARHTRISPDGRRLAVVQGGLNSGAIWIYDLAGSSPPIKITTREFANFPTWRPDGRSLTFSGMGPVRFGVFSIASDGSMLEAAPLFDRSPAVPGDWHPDGSSLIYQATDVQTAADLMLFERDSGQSRPWLQTPFNESEARFSPDGRLVAYVSDQTGRSEIWIRPLEGSGPPVRVSSDGGHEPRWARDGRQLFFESGARMMAVAIESLQPLRAAVPHVLFEGGFIPYNTTYQRSWDLAPDGRFLVAQMLTPPPRESITVVLNALDVKTGRR